VLVERNEHFLAVGRERMGIERQCHEFQIPFLI
jgi:hypothetical protein